MNDYIKKGDKKDDIKSVTDYSFTVGAGTTKATNIYKKATPNETTDIISDKFPKYK